MYVYFIVEKKKKTGTEKLNFNSLSQEVYLKSLLEWTELKSSIRNTSKLLKGYL